MVNEHHIIYVDSNQPIQLIDITNQVRSCIQRTAIQQGNAHVFSRHTTAGIRVNENEPQLLKDFYNSLKVLVPHDAHYFHNCLELRQGCLANERLNGHSHVQSLLLGASETVPIINGKLALGSWQSIFFVELDGARSHRQIIISIIGTT